MSDVSQLSFTPVIELSPGDFRITDHPLPQGSSHECPESWDRYWLASLRDAGIDDLQPHVSGSWMVSIPNLLRSKHLHKIMTVLLDLPDVDATPLCGGYILQHGDVLIMPQCCGDLGNLAEWEQLCAGTSEEFQMLWIGHPWRYFAVKQGTVMITEETEANHHQGQPIEVMIQQDELQPLLVLVRQDLIAAAVPLQMVLHSLGLNDSDQLAQRLLGLHAVAA